MARQRSLLFFALAASCATTSPTPDDVRVPADAATVVSLDRGTTVRLVASEGAPGLRSTGEIVDGWFREALRQSDALDFAGGPVAAAPTTQPSVRLRIDANTGLAQAELAGAGGTTLLAAVAVTADDVPSAIDELAVRVRIALGDPVTTPPRSVARVYSAVPEVVAACERAHEAAAHGEFASAFTMLQRARRLDGACTVLLDAMAATAAMQGDAATALRLAQEALALPRRLGPTTTHRLLRTLLLARASLEPELASRYDEELETLGIVATRERPFDPEVRLTKGIAANFLAKFTEARDLLTALASRLPEHAGVAYHLGWAALGTGDGAASARAFANAAKTLPARAVVVPRALAMWSAGDHDALRSMLAEVAEDPAVRAGSAWHEITRMRAAHELLRGENEAAVALVCTDLQWLLEHPATLDQRAGEFADVAETMVRLGQGTRLRPYLLAILEHQANTLLADAATYGLGLAEAATDRNRVPATEDHLRRRGAAFWADSLRAFGCRQRGELGAENQALGAAATQSSSPLVKAALVQNLRAQGRPEDAATLHRAMQREFSVLHLRRKLEHPLLGPEFAYAYLAP